MAAVAAPSATAFVSHFRACGGHAQRAAVQESDRNLLARRNKDSAERLPGHLHPFRGGVLIEALAIGEADRFQFVQGQNDFTRTGRFGARH